MTGLALPDVLSLVARAVSFVLLLQSAGLALFLALFGRLMPGSADAVRRTGFASSTLGLGAALALFALEAPRMAGTLAGLWDLSLQKLALYSRLGEALGLKVAGLTLLAGAFRARGELASIASVIGVSLAVGAFLVTGHTVDHPDRALLGPVLAVHLLIVAFWFGALPALYLATRRDSPAAAAQLIARFSARAVWLVPLIFLAGVAMVVMLVPGWTVFEQPYGELLLVKIGGFALLMGLAVVNRWRLGPAVASGELNALRALRASVASEYILIVGVLATTAVMTTLFSPQ
ncbi:MAG TPA: CopD family protein [Steroidobacteraceae bacterium]|nr:CopD family protein [Steroidobacteraceae bacterium]